MCFSHVERRERTVKLAHLSFDHCAYSALRKQSVTASVSVSLENKTWWFYQGSGVYSTDNSRFLWGGGLYLSCPYLIQPQLPCPNAKVKCFHSTLLRINFNFLTLPLHGRISLPHHLQLDYSKPITRR